MKHISQPTVGILAVINTRIRRHKITILKYERNGQKEKLNVSAGQKTTHARIQDGGTIT